MAISPAPSLEEKLQALIPAKELNSWELEELLACLRRLGPAPQALLFRQLAVVWPVSHALALSLLEAAEPALACLAPEEFAAWVREVLARYEAQGLPEARRFLADREQQVAGCRPGPRGLPLAAVQNRLALYLRGLAGRPLDPLPAALPGTDTVNIYLPAKLAVFPTDEANFLLYKLLASLQWALLKVNLYCTEVADEQGLWARLGRPRPAAGECFLDRFFQGFSQPPAAMAIYQFLQSFRALAFLQERLPGLMRDGQEYFRLLGRELAARETASDLLAPAYAALLAQLGDHRPLSLPPATPWQECQPAAWAAAEERIFLDTARIFAAYSATERAAIPPPALFPGSFLFAAAQARRLARRREVREQFVAALALRLPPAPGGQKEGDPAAAPAANAAPPRPEAAALRPPPRLGKADDGPSAAELRYLRHNQEEIEHDPKLRELRQEIVDDLGRLPRQYLDSAEKLAAGRGFDPAATPPEAGEGAPLTGTFLYDEWDFRRQGFRRNWCRLVEKELPPTAGTFIATALHEHRGIIKQLKREFEQLRSHPRFVGRQREGDDIDLDALTEALADQRAGRTPSERLYIRQLREQRDIATLFLVDISSSTEGWVGKTIKESLLVLAEALESLGDRYAIHAFSGMRRTRSEIFRVKEMNEGYGEVVRGRIAALAPQDYTRMGPPIRHCQRLLAGVEARIRLLVVLTDGKPEDYDDYKGEYALADTRHALIEAKNAGIHPFCITIDHAAQEYIARLFGEVHYLVINELRQLPRRLPEIYRRLTS